MNQHREPERADTFDLGDKIKLGVATGALFLLVLFFVLNFEQVEVDLLVVSPDLPLAVALVLSALLGLLVGLLAGLLRKKTPR